MNWLQTVQNNPLLRLVVSIAAGIAAYVAIYYGSKKWNLQEARHKEMGFGGGIAVTIIVWLLLQPPEEVAAQEQPAETIDIVPPPTSGVGTYPYNVQAPNIDLSLSLPQGNSSSCGCGCGAVDTGLSNLFDTLAKAFFANEQTDESAIVAAQLAAVPNWLSQYNNDQLPYEQAMSDTALFFSAQDASNTFLPGGLNPSIGAPPKYVT